MSTRIIAAIAVLFAMSACSDSGGADKALRGAGYKNVEITGYRFFGCGDHDFYHTGFSAIGADGSPVTGVVCAGFLKGSTIRLD